MTTKRQGARRECLEIGILFLYVALLSLSGCEWDDSPSGYSGEPELVAVAESETPDLEATFGLSMRGGCEISWGGASVAYVGAPQRITIDAAQKGRTAVVREHVRHEVLHIISRVIGHTDQINGVTVRDIVPSWGAEP